MKLRRACWVAIFLVLVAGSACSQNTGDVNIGSTAVQLFTNYTTGTATAVVPGINLIGASAHLLKYCSSGGPVKIDLEASEDFGSLGASATWIQVSPIGTLAGANTYSGPGLCNWVSAGGFHSFLRAHILSFTPSGGSLNVWYTGVASPIEFNPPLMVSTGNGQTIPIGCDSNQVGTIATGSANNVLFSQGSVNANVAVCEMEISFDAAPTATGTITIFSATHGTSCAGSPTTLYQTFSSSITPIIIGAPIGAIFRASGLDICVTTTAVGANSKIWWSYAAY